MSHVHAANSPHASFVAPDQLDAPRLDHPPADSEHAADAKDEECPCVTRLRDGVCGSQFSTAYDCYVGSTAEEKGSDCIEFFKMLQQCAAEHPGEFDMGNLAEEEKEHAASLAEKEGTKDAESE